MGTLSLLLIIPLSWPFIAKALWKREITWGEMALNLLVGVLVAVAGYYGSLTLKSLDVEIHNGQLVSKTSEHVSCEHSYSCNCKKVCTGSGSNRSCSNSCDTCYEHSYDVDWLLKSNIGDVKIDRIDRRGTDEPPRFSRAQRGDPVSLSHNYENLIKAAPHSLFNAGNEKLLQARFADRLLDYPSHVEDYHYVRRVLTQGVSLPDLAAWQSDLAKMLSPLGPRKQVNTILVFSKENDPAYADALRSHWLGGKKNDVVVVFGTPNYPEIAWVRVISWTDKELFKVELRDALQAQQTVNRAQVFATLSQKIESLFVRKSMKDFEYLRNEAELPLWLGVLLGLLAGGASVGLSRYFSRN